MRSRWNTSLNFKEILTDTGIFIDPKFQPTSRSSINAFPKVNQEECFTSWVNFLEEYFTAYQNWASSTLRIKGTDFETKVDTKVFESIRTIGPGKTYTACDGITRFSFYGQPTITTTTTYIETQTTYSVKWTANPSAKPFNYDVSSRKPKCRLDAGSCDRIHAYDADRRGPLLPGDELQTAENSLWLGLTGCGDARSCDLDVGTEIVLFYWPPIVKSRDICAANGSGAATTLQHAPGFQKTVRATAITFRGQDLYFRGFMPNYRTPKSPSYIRPSTMLGNWTFVWPTVYIAHHQVVASVLTAKLVDIGNGTAQLQTTKEKTTLKTSGVMAVSAKDVYSMYRIAPNDKITGTEFASLVANGKYDPGFTASVAKLTVKPFNFGDLKDPVPASAYFAARGEDCWGKQTHCATITDDTYRPQISLNHSIWTSIFPQNFYCRIPILVDPPVDASQLPDETLDDANFPPARRRYYSTDSNELSEKQEVRNPEIKTKTIDQFETAITKTANKRWVALDKSHIQDPPRPGASIELLFPEPTGYM